MKKTLLLGTLPLCVMIAVVVSYSVRTTDEHSSVPNTLERSPSIDTTLQSDPNVNSDKTPIRNSGSVSELTPNRRRPYRKQRDDHNSITQLSKLMPPGVRQWRNICADIDDIYKNKNVARIRTTYMNEYLKASDVANQQQDWPKRSMYRVIAKTHLRKAVGQFESFYESSTDDTEKDECAIAIVELSNKADDREKAIIWGKKLIEASANNLLRLKAYRYMSESYSKSGDLTNADECVNKIFTALPPETIDIYLQDNINTFREQLALGYQIAERLDDAALQNPLDADEYIKKRDDKIRTAIASFSEHLNPGTTILVEN